MFPSNLHLSVSFPGGFEPPRTRTQDVSTVGHARKSTRTKEVEPCQHVSCEFDIACRVWHGLIGSEEEGGGRRGPDFCRQKKRQNLNLKTAANAQPLP